MAVKMYVFACTVIYLGHVCWADPLYKPLESQQNSLATSKSKSNSYVVSRQDGYEQPLSLDDYPNQNQNEYQMRKSYQNVQQEYRAQRPHQSSEDSQSSEEYSMPRLMPVRKFYHDTDPQQYGNGRQKANQYRRTRVQNLQQGEDANHIYKDY